MSRKRKAPKKIPVIDPKYKSVIIPKLINSIMYDGGFMKNCFAQGLLNQNQVMRLMRTYTYEKTDLVVGAFLLNRICGKLPWFTKFVLYFMNASDESLRKKIIHYLMKTLQKKYGVN